MIDYRGYAIKPKRDFGPTGFFLDGRFIKIGYVVVRDSCNAMPGAAWFRTIEEAKDAIDVLIDVGSRRFWERMQERREQIS